MDSSLLAEYTVVFFSFFLMGGQYINQMEVQRVDLFCPTQHIRFVINLGFQCGFPGTKLYH